MTKPILSEEAELILANANPYECTRCDRPNPRYSFDVILSDENGMPTDHVRRMYLCEQCRVNMPSVIMGEA